jgi:hypothetical protein
MAGVKFSNFATSLLAAPIESNDTELTVTSSTGLRFPALSEEEDWCPIVVVDASGNKEIMRATGRTGDVITVTRAQEGTEGRAFEAGSRVDMRFTAAAFAEFVTAALVAILQGDIDDLNTAFMNLAAVALSGAFADLTGKPTTIAGYGITDGVSLTALNQALSAGFRRTPADLGTRTTGTEILDPGKGTLQKLIANGAFTIQAPAHDGVIVLELSNGSSIGEISFTNFKSGHPKGDGLTEVAGDKAILQVIRLNGTSYASILA